MQLNCIPMDLFELSVERPTSNVQIACLYSQFVLKLFRNTQRVHAFGRLFHAFVDDLWARIEQQRLRSIRRCGSIVTKN